MKMRKGFVLAILTFFASLSLVAQDIRNTNGYVQLFEVSSTIPKTNEKYYFENDTIKVTYYFWGSRGIMQISIFNKLDAPIYIDWRKSFMQNNFDKLIYAYEAEITPENVKTYKSYLHEGRSLSSMDYEAQYQMGQKEKKVVETITEVKPKGFYMSLRFHLVSGNFYKFPESASHVTETRSDNARETTEVYEVAFDSTNSPMKIKSVLTYSVSKDFTKQSTLTHSFWVSKIREMDTKHFMGEKVGKTPEGFPIYKYPSRKSSYFYLEIEKKNSIIFKMSKSAK